ncbi:MAG TPA: carboxypeptidase-like regulatory domain-containing protein [Gemmatimonadales bacterium]|nr:carboxypeptidase-like regulatory domain-containing protein [Gemmatimonadales bacterium]
MPLTPILIQRLSPPRPREARQFRLPLATERRRGWAGLSGSLAFHLLLIAVGLGLLRHPTLQQLEEDQARAQSPPPEVQLIPLTPPEERTEPEPEPPREERPQLIRPPVVTPPAPTIDVEDFPDVVDELASRGEDGDQGSTETPDASDPAPPATDLARAPTMEEEARRIFGRSGRRGGSGVEREEWTGPLPGPPNALETCTMPPLPQPKPGEPEPTSTAAGRILAEDNSTPLPGAHLQVIGQPYSTFSGSGGQYRLTIPRKLVENCRVQYVRVSAAGYRSRLLPLSLGAAPLSDDVSLNRR